MTILKQDIKYLQGVGPNRSALLASELGITTVGDLLAYYPYKYVDRSRIYKISDIDGNMPYVQLCGQILSFESFGEGRNKRLVAHFSDNTGVVDLVWFQGAKYITKTYDCHKPYIVFGKPSMFSGKIQLAHPEIENAPEGMRYEARTTGDLFEQPSTNPNIPSTSTPLQQGQATLPSDEQSAPSAYKGLCPSYNTSEKMKRSGLNSAAMAKLTANMFKLLKNPLDETLPAYITAKYCLMPYDDAVRNIHYPSSPEALRRAQVRLKFEELFYVQLNILRYVKDRQLRYKGLVFSKVGNLFNTFFHNHLPFTLTNAQKRVIKEMHADMKSGRQMNRLLQGDVGSGKTLVALMVSLLALDNGCQACIMAPTEILAEQHVETLRAFLGDMPVRVELLTGTVKGKRRTQILSDLITGDIHILVGTHAVIEESVQFHRLGLVVIDEQHRFGVAQRAKLWMKGAQADGMPSSASSTSDTMPPHVLVMTATPIPRTLAMTLYGDLDVSVIDELPPGRKPIRTIHQFDSHRSRIYELMRRELSIGRQVYIVYPLIKETEKMDMKDLEQGFEEISKAFPMYKVGKVHGKMKPAEKDVEMQRFANHETHILVSTTVIEVGVNVPNASVMIIENTERFGLSQLHQLRGRVGRGADQSYCVLVSKVQLSENTRKRIQIMVDSTDGFEIAEQDLKLRGPGDLEGTQQSGMAFDLKIANLARDGQILNLARTAAQEVIDNDPEERNSQNNVLWTRLRELRKTNINWGAIS
ncbi:MAG: ATP-dependent DNA helicase RecG [Prevotellaceae bacterium]|nr:ATP-dependent DNA helicase RecG [Candidatus Minthosoma caballi]